LRKERTNQLQREGKKRGPIQIFLKEREPCVSRPGTGEKRAEVANHEKFCLPRGKKKEKEKDEEGRESACSVWLLTRKGGKRIICRESERKKGKKCAQGKGKLGA